jgi:hypothetical protein
VVRQTPREHQRGEDEHVLRPLTGAEGAEEGGSGGTGVHAGRLSYAAMTAMLPATLAICLASGPEPIRDNSFLLEEAYNQEAGVVQHITTYQRTRGNAWNLGFTQEWPVASVRHQLSYTLGYLDPGPESPGFADVASTGGTAPGADDPKVALAPRVTALAPVGDAEKGLGAGGRGSSQPPAVGRASRWVRHAREPRRDASVRRGETRRATRPISRSSTSGRASSGTRGRASTSSSRRSSSRARASSRPEGRRTSRRSCCRRRSLAHDVGKLQIVPGIAVPLGVGPSSGDRAGVLLPQLRAPLQVGPRSICRGWCAAR